MHLQEKYYSNTEDDTDEELMGNYVHGTEPSHHIAYLYAWTSAPYKTQLRVREIMDRMYKNNIDGLCGNDDCGQMSAWYIFSSMGFYPVLPGSDEYVIGAPYFREFILILENGNKLDRKSTRLNSSHIKKSLMSSLA